MAAQKTHKLELDADDKKAFAKIDKLFKELKSDKSQPTFPDFFVHCMLFNIAERVNLKHMYPKTYFKVKKFLDEHNRKIVAWQKRHRK